MTTGKLVHILEDFDMQTTFSVGYDRAARSDETALYCDDPSRAVQSQKEEADINNIVKSFGVTGKLPQGLRVPTYGDFDGVTDYADAINAVREAERNFLKLPAELRKKLNDDPGAFVDYAADPANLEEMRKLGLAPAVAAAAPDGEGGEEKGA